MKPVVAIAILILLQACASSGIIPTDRGAYMVSKRSAQAGFGPPVGVKADVYREANEFCEKQNKAVETIDLQMVDSGFAKPGSVSLQFRCVEK